MRHLLLTALLAASRLLVGQTPMMTVRSIPSAPRIEDFMAMEHVTGSARQMTRIEGLVQRHPVDNAPVSQRTVAYLGYDSTNLYVAYVCFDEEPSRIRARLVSRDLIPNDDDTVAVMLDTLHDRKHLNGFQMNALGVQNDGVWTESDGSWDLSFDTVWTSQARLTSHGYIALFTIPFRSLRFQPKENQVWGIFLYRNVPRNNNEESYWPAYSSRIAGRTTQEGILAGLSTISRGRNVQFMPYASFRSSKSIDTRDPATPRFVTAPAEANGGLDTKVVLKNSLVLDLTVNPDFSQVESDQPQETLNQRFEVFFPEKRPFFIENASYFNTPINLLFTRRIVDPQFGAKLTGKIGKYAIGALLIDDRSPGEVVSQDDPLHRTRALFAAGRVNRDLRRDSSFGLMYTTRQYEGSGNDVGGADLRFRLNTNWIVAAQAVASTTTFLNGSHISGPAYHVGLDRSGRTLTYDLSYDDRSPGFVTEAGFVNRVDLRQAAQTLTYRFRPEGKFVVSFGPDVLVTGIWNHDATWLEHTYRPSFTFELARITTLSFFFSDRNEQLLPRDFAALRSGVALHEPSVGLSAQTSPWRQLSASVQYSRGDDINFHPPTGAAPYKAATTTSSVQLTVFPTRALTWDTTYLFTQLSSPSRDRAAFNHHIIRTKWNYQFTRALSTRVIMQYDAVLANQAFTSLATTKRFNADFLLTYLVHPGTAVYIGYNSDLRNLDPILAITPAGLRTGPRLLDDGHQFFCKISYLFRF